ncbi:MAG: nuclear transport factor 2 family protein [Planctomycetota bacterium]|jgi:hypothetical protein
MLRGGWVALILCQLVACDGGTAGAALDRKALAEQFFRGVYGCEPSVVPDLGADSILISYPIFEDLFNTPAIRGRENVEEFARGFCSRWKNAQITIREAIAEGDRVVLIWSFRARNVASGQESSWGGISLFRFDDAGKIIAEIGEESDPGPLERL